MAVIYRCDACNKLVEKDKDIVNMKILYYNVKEGIPDRFAADLAVYSFVCTECKNKILNFVNNEEGIQDGSEGNTQ